MSIKHYCIQVLVAIDRLVNTVIGGDAGETLSSVAFRKERDGTRFKMTRVFIDRLFYDGHCYNAYLNDRRPRLKE